MKFLSMSGIQILVIKNIDEFEGLVSNLSGMLNWIKMENVEPPYLYSEHNKEGLGEEYVKGLLAEIKVRLQPKNSEINKG